MITSDLLASVALTCAIAVYNRCWPNGSYLHVRCGLLNRDVPHLVFFLV